MIKPWFPFSAFTLATNPTIRSVVLPIWASLIFRELRLAHVLRLHVDLRQSAIPFAGFTSAPLFGFFHFQARHRPAVLIDISRRNHFQPPFCLSSSCKRTFHFTGSDPK